MHHLHISTTALFIMALFGFGIITVIVAAIHSIKQDRIRAEAAARRGTQTPNYPQYSALHMDGTQPAPVVRSYGAAAPSSFPNYPVYPMAPAYFGADPGLAMVEGMLIGEALSHGHGGNTYADTSSYDSGVSYDSGSSCDTDTSGGVSLDW